eukprot:6184331-Pleurochrysis_carterae.AAC.1
MSCRNPQLLAQAREVLRHLKGTRTYGLVFINKASGKTLLRGYMPHLNNMDLRGASDSDWAANRSTSGWVYTLAGAPIA